jgi:hypothetical protein
MSERYIRTTLFMPEAQRNALRNLSDSTGIGMSELMRRAHDKFLREDVLNDEFPHVSGFIVLRRD